MQYLSVSYSATLLAAGIRPSVGTTGDSFDNALSESLNGLYKTELIWALGVQDDEIAVEWETCKWVEWYNNRRRHGALTDDVSPSNMKLSTMLKYSLGTTWFSNNQVSIKPGVVHHSFQRTSTHDARLIDRHLHHLSCYYEDCLRTISSIIR